ncbi:hypothetical protein [Rhizobium sp. BK176]|uniref:hypothetical protein n=1 Tax=Rhizobium sp. BK176 TaxID=2587071 RepID=UPI002167E8B0|nr:hypothetical protein [Rhizobium sp. BK176]MCS4089289.1 hypothetical protein [Rhizobium sp. BK176]
MPDRDWVLGRKSEFMFGTTVPERLVMITAFAHREMANPGIVCSHLLEVSYNLAALFGRLHSLASSIERNVQRSSCRSSEKPKVSLVVEFTSQGNLWVYWVPIDYATFGWMRSDYREFGARRPVNELLMLHDFSLLWDSENFRDGNGELEAIVRYEVFRTALMLVETATNELSAHCEVVERWKFVQKDHSDRFDLLSPFDQEKLDQVARDKRSLEIEEAAALELMSKEQRHAEMLSRVAQWEAQFGMHPAVLLGINDRFQEIKTPLPGRAVIMTKEFGFRPPSDLSTFAGTMRTMRNTLQALNIQITPASLGKDAARDLARRHCGTVRKSWRK